MLICAAHSSSAVVKSLVSKETASILNSFHKMKFYTQATTIFELLWYHHYNVCVDERDRIFALYGLLPTLQYVTASGKNAYFDHHAYCPVDYKNHFSLVYTRLAASAVYRGHGLTILGHAVTFGSLALQDKNWPSWVPSWNMSRSVEHLPTFSQCGLEVSSYAEEYPSDPLRFGDPDERLSLALSGLVRPIAEVLHSEVDGQVMHFFDITQWPVHRGNHGPIPLLLEGIKQASNLCDRAPLDFDSIFPSPDLYNTDEGEAVRNTLACYDIWRTNWVQLLLKATTTNRPCEESASIIPL